MELKTADSRINLLKIPIDILDEQNVEEKIIQMLENKGNNQVIFLGFRDFIKGRNRSDFRNLLENAALVLPSSLIIARGIAFLHKKKAVTYIRYDFILKLLGVMEKYNKSIYIIFVPDSTCCNYWRIPPVFCFFYNRSDILDT